MTAEEAVIAVTDALADLGISYMLVGSFSTNHYGIPRSTKDADFVVELGDSSIVAVAKRLGPGFRLDPQISFETITGTLRHELSVVDNPFRVEIFHLSVDPHDQERFRRRLRFAFHGREAWLPTAEDVIITKLRWAAIAGRPKDRQDALDVIAVQDVEGAIDWNYVHSWCDRHGTRDLLDEVRRSIPPL